MILDGNTVRVSTNTSHTVKTRAASENWIYDEDAFAPGSYSKYKLTRDTNIELGETISVISVGAIIALLTLSNPVVAVLGGAGGAGAYAVYIDYMKKNRPYGRAIYAKNAYYSNDKPKLTGRPIEYYYKVVTTYYKDYENGSPSNPYSKKDTAYAKQLLYV